MLGGPKQTIIATKRSQPFNPFKFSLITYGKKTKNSSIAIA